MGTRTIHAMTGIMVTLFLTTHAVQASEPAKAGPAKKSAASWLTGDTNHKLEQLAKHHRGFDMAMVETGYRYSEVYFAGQEKNWEYALYQAEKIKVAIESGFERRPKRRASAEGMFLKNTYPKLIDAIKAKNASSFMTAFNAVTVSCNSCHHAEGVGFIKVHTPTARLTPVGAQN